MISKVKPGSVRAIKLTEERKSLILVDFGSDDVLKSVSEIASVAEEGYQLVIHAQSAHKGPACKHHGRDHVRPARLLAE